MADTNLTLKDGQDNSHNYVIRLHPAGEGIKIQKQLIELVAAAAPIISGLEKAFKDDPIYTIANAAFNQIEDDHVLNLILSLVKYSMRDNSEITRLYFDKAYAGNYAELYELIIEVIKVNFSSAISTFVNKMKGMAEDTKSITKNVAKS